MSVGKQEARVKKRQACLPGVSKSKKDEHSTCQPASQIF
ncbi:hypothetical protein [Polaromonas sp. CG9_12]|nr:hypothetical protein [Polaromonas sp. CG9_12]